MLLKNEFYDDVPKLPIPFLLNYAYAFNHKIVLANKSLTHYYIDDSIIFRLTTLQYKRFLWIELSIISYDLTGS